MHGFGVFLVGVYPGAFVDLNSEQLSALPPARQLRVYFAGVWHNFVLAALCLGVLATLPTLLWPFYGVPAAGATVHYVLPVRAPAWRPCTRARWRRTRSSLFVAARASTWPPRFPSGIHLPHPALSRRRPRWRAPLRRARSSSA